MRRTDTSCCTIPIDTSASEKKREKYKKKKGMKQKFNKQLHKVGLNPILNCNEQVSKGDGLGAFPYSYLSGEGVRSTGLAGGKQIWSGASRFQTACLSSAPRIHHEPKRPEAQLPALEPNLQSNSVTPLDNCVELNITHLERHT